MEVFTCTDPDECLREQAFLVIELPTAPVGVDVSRDQDVLTLLEGQVFIRLAGEAVEGHGPLCPSRCRLGPQMVQVAGKWSKTEPQSTAAVSL